MDRYQDTLENICCECECRVVSQEYIKVVSGKNYCGACYEGEENDEKVICHECDEMFNKNDTQIDNDNYYYCYSCWESIYDFCDSCENLVIRDDNPYEYDENNRLQCVCKDCQDAWIKNVANIRQHRMNCIEEQQDKLIEFCRKEGINEMLITSKSLEEIYNMIYEYYNNVHAAQ